MILGSLKKFDRQTVVNVKKTHAVAVLFAIELVEILIRLPRVTAGIVLIGGR